MLLLVVMGKATGFRLLLEDGEFGAVVRIADLIKQG